MQSELDHTLFEHCRNGHLEQAKYVYDLGANLNATQSIETFIPAYKDRPHSLEEGITITEEITPLFIAIDNRDLELTAWLIEEGANMHYNSGHNTPIHRAIRSGNIEMLSLLIDYDIDIHFGTLMDTPLLYAMHLKQYEMVELLLQHGANMNDENMLGISAKSLAAEMNDPRMTALFDPEAAEKARLEALKTPASTYLQEKWRTANASQKSIPIKRRAPSKTGKGFKK